MISNGGTKPVVRYLNTGAMTSQARQSRAQCAFLEADMPKFIKPFRGVPDGEIYPKQFAAGDECPSELASGANDAGALAGSV